MELEKFTRELVSLGLPVEPVVGFIKTLYTAKELPYEREVKTRERPYPTETLFKVDDWIVKLLHKYGFLLSGMRETTVYGVYANVRYYRLTQEGFKLGSQVFQRHLRNVVGGLVSVLDRYPLRLIRVAALSAISPRDGRASWLSVKVDGSDLDTVFSRVALDFEVLMMEPEELVRVYRVSKEAYGDLRLVFERLRRVRVRMYEPRVYDMFMSKVLVEYDGKVHREILGLMEELSSLGLVRRIPVYNSKGEYVGDEYRASPEVVYALEEYSSDADFDEARRIFLAIELILRALGGTLTKRELLIALDKLGVSEGEVKVALDIMSKREITTRYNEEGAPDSPAFIILKEVKAREEVKRAISLVENLILH